MKNKQLSSESSYLNPLAILFFMMGALHIYGKMRARANRRKNLLIPSQTKV